MADVKSTSDVSDEEYLHYFNNSFIQDISIAPQVHHSSPPLLGGAPVTARILCRNFTPKRHRQQWGKDLPKVRSQRGG